MEDQLEITLKLIDERVDFNKYESFKINKYHNINDPLIIEKLKKFKKETKKNIKIYYNLRTKQFDNVGVIDTDDCRIIDLDDDFYTMINKGIDLQTELKL